MKAQRVNKFEYVSKLTKKMFSSIREIACVTARMAKDIAVKFCIGKGVMLCDLPRSGYWFVLKRALKCSRLNWQVKGAMLLSYLKLVDSTLSVLPRSEKVMSLRYMYKNIRYHLKDHELVLKFRHVHPGFCVRIERCQVVRGYKPRACVDVNNIKYIKDDIPVRCNGLAYEVPKGR